MLHPRWDDDKLIPVVQYVEKIHITEYAYNNNLLE